MVEVNDLEPESTDICVFIVEGSPLMYFGELYYDAEDTERNRLVFKKALLKVLDAKTNASKWIRVPTSGKDSLVQIDTRTIRGVLVKNIDQEEAEEYKSASLKLYSKLHLAP